MQVDLSRFKNSWYKTGRGFGIRGAWYILNCLFFKSSLVHSSLLKTVLLCFFGAKIGKGVVLKPSINVKYPWNLEVGNNSWIGECVWLDSLAPITIGHNCCLSQGAYICTGNHDWSDPAFSLIVKPIIIEDGAWIGAKAVVLPGVTISTHSVVTAGSVISKTTQPYTIYCGNPAVPIKTRTIKSE